MALALREMARAARSGALLILVIGRESSVRGIRFFNGELVAEIAVRCVGLEIERRQERMFRNRYGIAIYEDILHFRSSNGIPSKHSSLAQAREIAGQVLSATRSLVPRKERSGIDDALEHLNMVSPSPMAPPTALSHILA